MYKKSARFKKRNTYVFTVKETTVNSNSVHNNTCNKQKKKEKNLNLLYFGRIFSFQPILYCSVLSCVCRDRSKCIKYRGFEKARLQMGGARENVARLLEN